MKGDDEIVSRGSSLMLSADLTAYRHLNAENFKTDSS